MGAFGAPTAKPTRLFSDHKIVKKLHRKLPRGFEAQHTTTTVDEARKAAGVAGVTGIKDQLHQTQEHPWDYGTAVKDCLVDLRQKDLLIDSDSEAETEADPTDKWDDAWSNQLAGHLDVPTTHLLK